MTAPHCTSKSPDDALDRRAFRPDHMVWHARVDHRYLAQSRLLDNHPRRQPPGLAGTDITEMSQGANKRQRHLVTTTGNLMHLSRKLKSHFFLQNLLKLIDNGNCGTGNRNNTCVCSCLLWSGLSTACDCSCYCNLSWCD